MRKYQFLLCCMFIILLAWPLKSYSELNDDAQDIYHKWLQCVAEKGENNKDCNKLFQKFLTIAYKKLEDLKEEYRKKCSDPEKADSDYCKKLKKQIEELEEAIQGVTGQREKQQREKAVNSALKEDWEQVFAELSFIDLKHLQPEDNLLLGYASLHLKDWIKAWEHFYAVDKSTQKDMLLSWSEKLCKENPSSAIAFVLKGDVLARLGKYEEAVRALDNAVKLDEKCALTYDVRGLVKITDGELHGGKDDLEKALQINPEISNVIFEKGIIYLITGDFEEATTHMSSLLNEEPKFFLARNARGVAYLLQAKYDEAMHDFEQVIHDNPAFVDARNNKTLAALLRAKGLFTVDIKNSAALSPKGILGAKATTNLFYAGAGINSPDGGDTLKVAKLRAGSDALVVQIREKDYLSRGLGHENPRLATEVATLISMKTRQAQAEGKNLIVNVIPNLEKYGPIKLATDMMMGGKEWKNSKTFCGIVMDAVSNGYRQVEPTGKAIADIHSFHGDAFSITHGNVFDVVNAWKTRTGGDINGDFANRLRDYAKAGSQVNLITSSHDAASLFNVATKSTADSFARAGIANSYFDKLDHGQILNHGISINNTAFDINTKTGKTTVVGNLIDMTGASIPKSIGSIDRSGVFLKMGEPNMDVTRTKKTDLSFLLENNKQSAPTSNTTDEEPDISYPFLILNPSLPITSAFGVEK